MWDGIWMWDRREKSRGAMSKKTIVIVDSRSTLSW